MSQNQIIQLQGRLFLRFHICAVTGLHIGGTNANIEIGGVDKSVIRDVLTNRPYIPGSSLKGKMRSLLEKYNGLAQNQRIGQGCIHSCEEPEPYRACDVCQVFGVPGERNFGTPTRLVVRDALLTDDSADALTRSARTDLPFTEVKTEVSIDRVTSAANPRQMERTPAGALFGPAEIVYSFYSGDDCDVAADIARLNTLVSGLQLLEDDYLGGLGSRGSGRVRLQKIEATLRCAPDYLQSLHSLGEYADLSALAAGLSHIQATIRERILAQAGG